MSNEPKTTLIRTPGFISMMAQISDMAATLSDNEHSVLLRDDFDAMILANGLVREDESAISARNRVLTAMHRIGPKARGTYNKHDNVLDLAHTYEHEVAFRIVVISASEGEYALHRITSYAETMPKKSEHEHQRAMDRYDRELSSLLTNTDVDPGTKSKLIAHKAAVKMLGRQSQAAHDALQLAFETGADAIKELAMDAAANAAKAEVEADIARNERLALTGS